MKLKDPRVRVVHGNTLTAAVVIKEIPLGTREVFLTGATSKLGRAISLYLCQQGVKVSVREGQELAMADSFLTVRWRVMLLCVSVHCQMMTTSDERFETIQKEAPEEYRHLLVQAKFYKDGSDDMGVWEVDDRCPAELCPPRDPLPSVCCPPLKETRKDCPYGKLAALKLPKGVQNLRSCEMTMDREFVHACHAGGLVHALEGWEFHEVGAVDPPRIDIAWEAAMKHGFSFVQ